MLIAAAEIKNHLDEINLTLHPQERNKKMKWFFKYNIRIFTYEQKVILETPTATFVEITAHMKRLKAAHNALKSVFNGCKHEKIVLIYENGEYKNKEKEISSASLYYVAMANVYVDEIKQERTWFKERKLLIKLIHVSDISDYVYIGPSEIAPHEIKRKEENI